MNTYLNIFTDLGLQKQAANLYQNTEFKIDKIVIGDANGSAYTPNPTQTSLVNQRNILPITNIEPNGNIYRIYTKLPANIDSYTIREIGLLDEDNNLVWVSQFEMDTVQDIDNVIFENILGVQIEVTQGTSVVITDNNILTANKQYVDDALENLLQRFDKALNSKPTGLEICDIGMSLYVDESKGLRRYLNGQIVDINENTQPFADKLKQIVNLHPSLACSEEDWQNAKEASDLGQVGKFVINEETGYIRLPRVVNIQGVFDLQNLGLTVDAGLPNITGSLENVLSVGNPSNIGAFYKVSSNVHDVGSSGGAAEYSQHVGFNASRSSNIYGNSNTVQQEAVQFPYFIQIANGAQEQVNIVNNIELNNPYSFGMFQYSNVELNNLSWLKSEGQYNPKSVYPDYYNWILTNYNEGKDGFKSFDDDFSNTDWVINTANETFRLPLKTNSAPIGLNMTAPVVGNGMTLGLTNGTGNFGLAKISTNNVIKLDIASAAYGTNVNTTAGLSATLTDKSLGITTDGSKSGIVADLSNAAADMYLYFYVGETIQNANLINAASLSELVVEKTDMLQASAASLPSGVHVNLTLGESGTSYIAPADGYFRIQKQPGVAGGNVCLATASCSVSQQAANTNHAIWLFIPVRKNQVMNVWYSATGATDLFEFVHTEGAL